MQDNMKQAQAVKEPPTGKTIGVKFPMAAYRRIVLVKEKYGIKTIKGALLFIAEKGCDRLLDGK
jgi:hypothetical protein